MVLYLESLIHEPFCYLTTTGRITGRQHTIEIWFGLHKNTFYMLAGNREKADWVKNIRKQPHVHIRIQQHIITGNARDIRNSEEDALARQMLFEKYHSAEEDLTDWAATALPVAVDLVSTTH